MTRPVVFGGTKYTQNKRGENTQNPEIMRLLSKVEGKRVFVLQISRILKGDFIGSDAVPSDFQP